MTVRDSITKLRVNRGTNNQSVRPASEAKIVAIIPDFPYDLRRDIGLTTSSSDAWRNEDQRLERAKKSEELGLAGTNLTVNVAGIIDDIPVIKTRAIAGKIAVLDLSKLANDIRPYNRNEMLYDPDLTVIERTQEPVSTAIAESEFSQCASAASADPGSANTGEPQVGDSLQVKLHASLRADISLAAPGAAQILTWDKWS